MKPASRSSVLKQLLLARHIYRARSKFGIHSPFVYKFYASVLKDTGKYPEYEILKSGRDNKQEGKDRTLRMMFRISRYFGFARVRVAGDPDESLLEAVGLGSPQCTIIRTDQEHPAAGEPPFSGLMLFHHTGRSSFREIFPAVMQQISPDSVLIFTGIYDSEEMNENWNEARNHPSVTVTIDLFHLGILFFREELSKEEFILRF